MLLAVGLLAACSGAPDPTATATPTPASLTPDPTTTPQRDLVDLPAEAGWHPVLELLSGLGGRDSGNFDVSGRYRIRFDCVGTGSIRIKVDTEIRATRDCQSGVIEEPVTIRGASGNLHAAVVVEGDPEWIVRLEVE